MPSLASVTKITSKIIPTSKGVIQNSVTGVGADAFMRTIDDIFGSPVQRIFSYNLPFLGSIGPIDFINYVGHAGGFYFSKKGLIAVLAAKIVGGTLSSLGPIRLPGSGAVPMPATAQQVATSQAAGGASF